MTEKKLGVLGGMGPLATSVFFDRVVQHTEAMNDQEHINMVILNHTTLPDRTTAIMTGEEAAFLSAIQEDLKLFEMAKVANIVIPCNTSHYFFEHIQAMTEINIINMIEHTVSTIRSKDGSNCKVAILGTDGTINSHVYENECIKQGIEPFIPQKDMQANIMKIIYNIKSDASYQGQELNDIISNLLIEEECTSIILGCTELSCIKLEETIQKYAIDPMNILVEEAIKQSGKKVK